LSLAVFSVKYFPASISFQPEALTDAERSRLGISKHVITYFEPQAGILTAQRAEESVRYFVHEDVLANVQFLTGETGSLAQSIFLKEFISGIVYATSMALKSLEETDPADKEQVPDSDEISESAVMALFKNTFKSIPYLELVEMLKASPEKLVARWSDNPAASKRELLTFQNLTKGNNDVSSTDN
jgi:hypothetical protein